MQDISVDGSGKCLRGPFFTSRDKILLLGEALQFGGIFQKICIKIIKNLKDYEDISEKCKFFTIIFIFRAVLGKLGIIIYLGSRA